MNLSSLKTVEEATQAIEDAGDANCSALVKKFQAVLSALTIDEPHQAPEIILAKLHAIKRAFSHLNQLAIEIFGDQEEGTDIDQVITPEENEKLSIQALWRLTSAVLSDPSLIRLAMDLSLPKFVHFAVCDVLFESLLPRYSLLPRLDSISMSTSQVTEIHAGNVLSLLEFVLSTPLTLPTHTNAFCHLSNIISIFSKLIKTSYIGTDPNTEPFIQICWKLCANASLGPQFEALIDYMAGPSNREVFDALAIPILELVRRSFKAHLRHATPFITITHESIRALLIQQDPSSEIEEADEGNEEIRDVQVARKIFGMLLAWSEARPLEAPLFSHVVRVVPILFASTLHSKTKVHTTSTSLISKAYKSSRTKQEDSDVFHPGDTSQGLHRAVVMFGLSVVARALSLDANTQSSEHMATDSFSPSSSVHLESAVLLLGRTLASRGLFSLNPTSTFLHLFSEQDDHLVQALHWLQSILISCHRPSANSLAATLLSKVPQISSILRVLTPYTLFVSFLSFIHYDHSIMLDFLLSPETEYFLRYLLGFARFCLADWNRTFVSLFEIKSHRNTTQSEANISNDQVDDILELLLRRQLEELNLESGERSPSPSAGPSQLLSSTVPAPSFPDSTPIDLLLQNSSETESAFDATMTALIRLLFHLEKASEFHLLDYNIQALLSRLREIENRYEKLEEEG